MYIRTNEKISQVLASDKYLSDLLLSPASFACEMLLDTGSSGFF